MITAPGAGGNRPTKDVDAIVDVTSYAKYTALSERLRVLGCAVEGKSGVRLMQVRKGRRNPSTDPLAIAQLLWRNEVSTRWPSEGSRKGCAPGI